LTEEPDFRRGSQPERALQAAIVAEIAALLAKERQAAGSKVEDSFVLQGFGLDIGVFTRCGSQSAARFLEVKAFVGSRAGGVGFGTRTGGSQVDLLMLSDAQLRIADALCAWIVADGTRPRGSRRFALITSTQARTAAMGRVARGKQNNFSLSKLAHHFGTWDELSLGLEGFLIS